jgi:carboxypeptidase C (cathepsin A)
MEDIEHSYAVHAFFWYFRARRNPETAPLVIRISGGPGASSIWSLFTENGSCQVNPDLTTSNNQWSWNNEFNVLYIDQPVQAGFSYDMETNGTLDLTTGTITVSDSDSAAAVNQACSPARIRVAQPTRRQMQPDSSGISSSFGCGILTSMTLRITPESYGGRFGPGFSAYLAHFQPSTTQQNNLVVGLLT